MKKRIVCLHGYSQSKDRFMDSCRPIELASGPDKAFVYPQGLFECPEDEVRRIRKEFNRELDDGTIGPSLNYGWYRASRDDPPVYQGIEETLQQMESLFSTDGPIDGVIGHSMGALLACILIGLIKANPESAVKFNWAVLMSGVLPRDSRFARHFQEPVDMPVLQVYGEAEPEHHRVEFDKSARAFSNLERVVHPGGHVVPTEYPDAVARIASWIDDQCDRWNPA